MRVKRTLTKNFGVKTTMEEIKAMAQEIWKITILYPRTSKNFYHHIKFRKSIMNSEDSTKKAVLKNFLRKHLCWSLFFIKMQTYRPANLLKRHSNTGVFLTVIFKNSYFEEEPFPTWTNNILNYLGSEEVRSFLQKQNKNTILKLS